MKSIRLVMLLYVGMFTPTYALSVTIGFEYFPGSDGLLGTIDDIPINPPDGFNNITEQLTTQYENLGIVFTPNPPQNDMNEIAANWSFGGTSGSGNNLLSTNRQKYEYGPVGGRFLGDVYELSMAIGLWADAEQFFAGGSYNTLEVFDIYGNLLNSVTASDEYVTINTNTPIATFRVLSTSRYTQAAIDDITFTVVPIPPSILLFMSGFIGLSLFSRRKFVSKRGRSL